jgi:methyl-accepting chemotaxis protein
MDEATQQNAALAEQSAGSAKDLAGQIEALRELVGFFRLGQDQSPGQAAVEPMRPRALAVSATAEPRRPMARPEPRSSEMRSLESQPVMPRRKVAGGWRRNPSSRKRA